MAKGKWEGVYEPQVGDLLSFKLAAGDLDLIPWIASKQLKRGEMGEFLRSALREKLERERNGISHDVVQALAAQLAGPLAERLQGLLATGAPVQPEAVGKEVEAALNSLNDATEDLLSDLGIG